MDDCQDDTAVHGVETSSPVIQNHLDYISLKIDLHKCPLIMSKEQLKNIYPECFDGIGKFKDYKYHISIEENTKPVVHPARKVALVLQPKLKKEYECLVEQGIITPVEIPTDWVNSLVVREKPDVRLRICQDQKDLNRVIKCKYHPVPSIEDILPKLKVATEFTKLDVQQAFLNVLLDEESSYLMTFNIPGVSLDFLECLLV